MTTGSASQKLSFEFDASGVGTVTTALDRIKAALGDIEAAVTSASTRVASLTADLSAAAAAAARLRTAAGRIDFDAPGLTAIARDLASVSAGLASVRTAAGPALGAIETAATGAATKLSAVATAAGRLATALAAIRGAVTIDVRVTGDAAAITALGRLATAVDRLIDKLIRLRTTLDDIVVALRAVATAAGAATAALAALTGAMPPPSSAATISSIASSLSSVSTAAGSASSGARTLTSRLAAAGAAGARALGAIVGLLRQAAGLALRVGAVSVGGAAAAGGALGLVTKETADDIVQISRLSRSSGFSGGIKGFAAFADAARLFGIEVDDVAGALEGLQDNYVNARLDPTSDLARAFERLGVQIRSDTDEAKRLAEIQSKINELRTLGASVSGGDVAAIQQQIDALERSRLTSIASGMLSADELVAQLADGFARMGNSPARSFLASTLIGGDDGIRLIPLLEQGAAGLRKTMQEAAEAGGQLTDEQIRAAFAVNGAFARLSIGFRGVRREILAAIGPDLAEQLNNITAFFARNRSAIAAWAKYFVAEAEIVIRDVVTLFSGAGTQIQTPWLAGLTGAAAEVRRVFGEVFAWLSGQPSAVPAWIQALREAATTEFGGLFADFMAVYERDIRPIFAELQAFFAFARGLATDIASVISGVIGPLATAAEPLLAALRGLTGAENNRQLAILAGLLAPFVGIFASIGAAAVSVISIFGSLIGIVGSLVAGLAALVGWPAILGALAIAAAAAAGALIRVFQDDIIAGIDKAIDFIASSFDSLWTKIVAGARSVGTSIRGALSAIGIGDAPASPSTTTPPGFADGGQVSGPGGPTSDSILARLSTGEYVVRAAAVRQYGTDFLNRINSLRLPGFASGGFVGAMAMPRMSVPSLAGIGADGGGMGAGLTLVLPSGQSVAARTSDAGIRDIKAALQRTARVSSSGSQPAWR